MNGKGAREDWGGGVAPQHKRLRRRTGRRAGLWTACVLRRKKEEAEEDAADLRLQLITKSWDKARKMSRRTVHRTLPLTPAEHADGGWRQQEGIGECCVWLNSFQVVFLLL